MNLDKYEGHEDDIGKQLLLTAEAPLLLAEIKRLRKQVQAAHEWVQDYF